MVLAWIGLGVVALVTAILFERRRQLRELRRAGESPGTGTSLLGAGALELQRQLQPDRSVELIREELRRGDRVHPEHRPARPSDGELPDAPPRRGAHPIDPETRE
jgi:hypothetical protein